MNELSDIIFFVLFIIPGFISIQVYDLLIPGNKRDFSKSIIQMLSYSCINTAVFLYPVLNLKEAIFLNFDFTIWMRLICILFLMPILWPVIFLVIINKTPLQKYVVHPCPKPWDWIFGKPNQYWILIHLKDGRKIGGKYGANSYASSFPHPEQIYLSELWSLDEEGQFIKKIERTNGILIDRDQWELLEFFEI